MQAVLDEVGERLLNSDESLIRIPEVCEATGVNYGSVYHHFGSREGVIDAAYNMLFSQFAAEDIRILRAVSETSNSLGEYVANMSALTGTFSSGPERIRRRSIRVRIVAASLTRPQLRDLIGVTQQGVTEELSNLVQNGQDRGWLRSDVSAHSISVVLQSLLVGRVIDDVSSTPIDPVEWENSIAVLLMSLLNKE
jgi:AcrR family transcriptional regulator